MTTNLEGGLLHAYLLDGKGGGRQVDWQAVESWTPESGPIWLHLDRNDDAVQQWLRTDAKLDYLVADTLMAEETRPRTVTFRDGVLSILRGVNLNPGADPEDMVAMRIWVEENRVISVRARQAMAAQDVRRDLEENHGPKDSGELLAWIGNRMVDRMGPIVDDMADVVDGLEDELLVSENREIRHKLREMRREAIGLRRYLAPQRDALSRLYQEEHHLFQMNHRQRFRETADRVLRIVEELDELRERASIIQDELSTRIAEQMNRTMYVLTVVASVLLPISAITGLLGINVGGMPGEKNEFAFWIVIAILGVLVVGQVWLFKKLKWM